MYMRYRHGDALFQNKVRILKSNGRTHSENISRRNHSQVLCKIAVLKNFTTFRRKRTYWSIFFSSLLFVVKFQAYKVAALLKKKYSFTDVSL